MRIVVSLALLIVIIAVVVTAKPVDSKSTKWCVDPMNKYFAKERKKALLRPENSDILLEALMKVRLPPYDTTKTPTEGSNDWAKRAEARQGDAAPTAAIRHAE